MTQIDRAGGGTVRVCANCGAPFITTTTWAEYCTRSCRLAHNKRTQRKRKSEALRLAAEGVPLAQIAKRVEAKDVETVRGWIDAARAKEQSK